MSELLKEACMSLACHLSQGGLPYTITYGLPCAAYGDVEGRRVGPREEVEEGVRAGVGQGVGLAALWRLRKSYPEKGERRQIKKITESNLIAEYFWLRDAVNWKRRRSSMSHVPRRL